MALSLLVNVINVLISMNDELEVNLLVNHTGLQKFPIARDGSSLGKNF